MSTKNHFFIWKFDKNECDVLICIKKKMKCKPVFKAVISGLGSTILNVRRKTYIPNTINARLPCFLLFFPFFLKLTISIRSPGRLLEKLNLFDSRFNCTRFFSLCCPKKINNCTRYTHMCDTNIQMNQVWFHSEKNWTNMENMWEENVKRKSINVAQTH